jgi:hypothetical protein
MNRIQELERNMKVVGNSVSFGDFSITFQRTLRLPEDGKTHSLPPGFGGFPIKRVEDYADKVPAEWNKHGGVFIPMFQREALWLSFSCAWRKHFAVKVAAGKVNACSGQPWNVELKKPTEVAGKDPEQDYMVCPNQRWLDGFNVGEGVVRQFVAMPLGMGYTVEAQVTAKEEFGGLQLLVIPAKPGAIPEPTGGESRGLESLGATYDSYSVKSLGATRSMTSKSTSFNKSAEMGLAAGGKMTQKIYEDPYGIDVWDQDNAEKLFVHIVNSEMYKQITGENPPSSPISAHTYTQNGYPWFSVYDEGVDAIGGSGTLANVKPISQKDAEHGFTGQQDDSALNEKKNVKKLPPTDKSTIKDGDW